jgi:WD40 repeat protein
MRDEDGSFEAEPLASLTRHSKSVNAVRFAPCAELLASGGDGNCFIQYLLGVSYSLAAADGTIFIWKHEKEKDNTGVVSNLDDKLPDKVFACFLPTSPCVAYD